MNKYLKKIIILVILLLGYILFIGSYKIEFKKQINDGNIKISINNFLTDFFSLKNSQLSGNELIKEFYEGGYFQVRDDLLSYVYSNKFFYNLENNYKKENIKNNITIKNVYQISKNKYKVIFNENTEFNYIDNPNLIKEENSYSAVLLTENNDYIINELYNEAELNDFAKEKMPIISKLISKHVLYKKYIKKQSVMYKNLSKF